MAYNPLRLAASAPRPLPPPSYEPPGLGRLRKIALIGMAQTHAYAPWHDPSWEIWAHASAWKVCPRVDRFFDLHPRHIWNSRKGWHKDYQGWLKKLPVPIYMQDHYNEIPQSVRYPKERVLSEYRRYATSQAAWMIALALTEGVTHLGFFGVHYSTETEYKAQRPGCEYWMGVAEGRGVQLVIPQGCPLLHEPAWLLYGYENYKSGQKKMPELHAATTPPPAPVLTILAPGERPTLQVLSNGEAPAWERSPFGELK